MTFSHNYGHMVDSDARLPVKLVLIVLPVLLPRDSLVHQTLLKSVRQSLVHQAVADKGSTFSQRRLQLQHIKQVHSFKKKTNKKQSCPKVIRFVLFNTERRLMNASRRAAETLNEIFISIELQVKGSKVLS